LDVNLVVILFIVALVLFLLLSVCTLKGSSTVYERHRLEFTWTMVPGLVLVGLGVPSLSLLYNLEASGALSLRPALSLKVTGHQ
jgi:heme/copper-type cytochrome/quinol oxidase subunit 2